nr:unnamed protein product [Callosobruchus chinensis]
MSYCNYCEFKLLVYLYVLISAKYGNNTADLIEFPKEFIFLDVIILTRFILYEFLYTLSRKPFHFDILEFFELITKDFGSDAKYSLPFSVYRINKIKLTIFPIVLLQFSFEVRRTN